MEKLNYKKTLEAAKQNNISCYDLMIATSVADYWSTTDSRFEEVCSYVSQVHLVSEIDPEEIAQCLNYLANVEIDFPPVKEFHKQFDTLMDRYGMFEEGNYICEWCGNEFEETEGDIIPKMGFVCDSCQMGVKSRGEKL